MEVAPAHTLNRPRVPAPGVGLAGGQALPVGDVRASAGDRRHQQLEEALLRSRLAVVALLALGRLEQRLPGPLAPGLYLGRRQRLDRGGIQEAAMPTISWATLVAVLAWPERTTLRCSATCPRTYSGRRATGPPASGHSWTGPACRVLPGPSPAAGSDADAPVGGRAPRAGCPSPPRRRRRSPRSRTGHVRSSPPGPPRP